MKVIILTFALLVLAFSVFANTSDIDIQSALPKDITDIKTTQNGDDIQIDAKAIIKNDIMFFLINLKEHNPKYDFQIISQKYVDVGKWDFSLLAKRIKSADKPTETELKIYCASQDDLFKYPNDPEKVSNKRICKRFGISEKDLDQIYINVMVHAKGINPCQKKTKDKSYEKETMDEDVHGAWSYMQLFVEKRLKSPRSAQFPFGGYQHVTQLGDARYKVQSYVDADNAFGVKIRTNFEGVIKKNDKGWELEYLNIE